MATVTQSTSGSFLSGAFNSGDTLDSSAVSNPTICVNRSTTFGGLITHAGGLTLQPANGNVTFVLPNATFAGVVSIKGGMRSVERNATGSLAGVGVGGV